MVHFAVVKHALIQEKIFETCRLTIFISKNVGNIAGGVSVRVDCSHSDEVNAVFLETSDGSTVVQRRGGDIDTSFIFI